MKKNLIKILISLCVTLSLAAGLAGCSKKQTTVTTDVESDSEPVCYYGCPNSGRIKKLNLKKRKLQA